MDLYAENILDHSKHPRHKTVVDSATIEHGEKNLSCGDTVHIQLRLDGDRIVELGWTGEGCAISQAAMSILSEELQGKTIGDIDLFTPQAVRELLGVPVSTRRVKCAFLSLHALKNLLHRLRGQPEQTWPETVAEA